MDSATLHPFWLLDFFVDPLESSVAARDGEVYHLQNKPMEVLVVLALAQGKVVPSESIIDAVWGERSGGDEGLKRCIHAIRKVFKDTSSDPRIVRTVRGRGYACIPLPRFEEADPAASVTAQGQPGASEAALQRERTISVISIILSTSEPSSKSDEFVVPMGLLKQYLDVIGRYGNANAYDLGVMSTVVFGLYKTCDDDQLAAIECAVALLDVVLEQSDEMTARIGIATETITVSSLGQFPRPIVHNASAIRAASALAAMANDGEIVVCDLTAELCQTKSDGKALKSIAARVRTQSVTNPFASAFGVRQVGRDSEFTSLLTCWNQTAEGDGLVAYVSGDAGIGKTSLCNRLLTHVREQRLGAVIECRGQARSSSIPLYPVLRAVSHAFGLEQIENQSARAELVKERVRQLGFTDPLAVQVLADFLHIDLGEHPRSTEPGSGLRRTILLEVLTRALIANADRPRLLFCEDIHWADPLSIELLEGLIQRGPIANTMILITSRSELHPDWVNRSHVMHINLRPLDKPACLEIVREIDRDGVLDNDAINRINDAAAGNPLFVIEVTKSAIASHSPEAALGKLLPKSVRQVLLARVDSLGEESETLRYASIVGTVFSFDSLQAVSTESVETLEVNLGRLCDANMVHKVSAYPKATYVFSHSLLQVAVYESIPVSTRKVLHERKAYYIEARSVPVEKDLLAYHFEAAELFEKAAHYWLEAADRARRNCLFPQAQQHYRRALAALPRIAPGAIRDALEVQIRIEYGPVLMAQAGYAHVDVKDNYMRAGRIMENRAVKHSDYFPIALFGMWTYRVVTGDFYHARALGDELLELAVRKADADLEIEAAMMAGVTHTHMGEFKDALEKLQQVLAMYDEERHAQHKWLYAQDPGMSANLYCGVVYSEKGESTRAEKYHAQGLKIARDSGHWPSLCLALTVSARHKLECGEYVAAAKLARECYDIAEQQGFPTWAATSKFMLEAADFAQHPSRKTVEQMALWRSACMSAGQGLWYLDFSSALAEAYMDLGDLDAAENILRESRAEMERSGKSAVSRSVSAALQRLAALGGNVAPIQSTLSRKPRA